MHVPAVETTPLGHGERSEPHPRPMVRKWPNPGVWRVEEKGQGVTVLLSTIKLCRLCTGYKSHMTRFTPSFPLCPCTLPRGPTERCATLLHSHMNFSAWPSSSCRLWPPSQPPLVIACNWSSPGQRCWRGEVWNVTYPHSSRDSTQNLVRDNTGIY